MPSVTILLATYNGEQFLEEQLASIAGQDVETVNLIASDDRSTDRTRDILARWQAQWTKGKFHILDGPGRGVYANFRQLGIEGHAVESDYYAFADQDDVWEADKLSSAIAILSRQPADKPALYFSRTRLIDAGGRPMGFSPWFRRPPSFRNALVQSIGGGNTIVLNRAGFALFAESARRTAFATHDWWCYIICSGAGAYLYYDPQPHIGYRQHGGNIVGKNSGPVARLNRLTMLFRGRFAAWTDNNLDSLDACADLLSADAVEAIAELRAIRARRGVAALAALRRSKIYRQTFGGNLGLAAAAAMGKV